MAIDIALGIFVAWIGWLGTQAGPKAQLLRLVTYALAVWGATLIAPHVASTIAQVTGWSPRLSHGAGSLGLTLGLLAVGIWFTGNDFHMARKERDDATTSWMGGLLGLVSGAVLAWGVAGSLFVIVSEASPVGAELRVDRSEAMKRVVLDNPADPDPYPWARALIAVASEEEREAPTATGRAIREALRTNEAKPVRTDPHVLAAIRKGDWSSLRSDPRVLRFVSSPAFVRAAVHLYGKRHDG